MPYGKSLTKIKLMRAARTSYRVLLVAFLFVGLPLDALAQERYPRACFRWPQDAHPLDAQRLEEVQFLQKLAEIQAGEKWIRLKRLEEEMTRFSKQVGHCYGRPVQGRAEKLWAMGEREKKIKRIYDATNVRAFCAAVKENIVDKRLPNFSFTEGSSPFRQYANCGEGALVGACLAYAFGFSEEEVLLCDSEHDHAWALVPEPEKKNSYCLLDRWNSFRCGVTFSGKKTQSEFIGDFRVPGKANFKFSDAICKTLTAAPVSLESKR